MDVGREAGESGEILSKKAYGGVRPPESYQVPSSPPEPKSSLPPGWRNSWEKDLETD